VVDLNTCLISMVHTCNIKLFIMVIFHWKQVTSYDKPLVELSMKKIDDQKSYISVQHYTNLSISDHRVK